MELTSPITSLLQALRLKPEPSKGLVKAPHKTFPTQKANGTLPTGLQEITLADVAYHDRFGDCWVVIYDRVYDVTNFLNSHPGGEDVILDHAGRDATLAFHGTGHSKDAIEMMRDYLIGELPVKERIFRRANARVLLTGVPE